MSVIICCQEFSAAFITSVSIPTTSHTPKKQSFMFIIFCQHCILCHCASESTLKWLSGAVYHLFPRRCPFCIFHRIIFCTAACHSAENVFLHAPKHSCAAHIKYKRRCSTCTKGVGRRHVGERYRQIMHSCFLRVRRIRELLIWVECRVRNRKQQHDTLSSFISMKFPSRAQTFTNATLAAIVAQSQLESSKKVSYNKHCVCFSRLLYCCMF
jgi:hypothetical protein